MVHTVVTGGQALLDTLDGAAKLVEQLDDAPFVIWLNPFWGPVADNGKSFEQMRTYQEIRSRIETVVSLPAFIDTGLNVVDVRDVAQGHLLAWERGRAGERYILGSENLTLKGILGTLASITGRKAPTVELPYFVAWTAGVITTALAQVTGTPPRAPLEAVRMAKKKMWVSHAKATAELGFAPRPARLALDAAVTWFEGRA